MYFLNLALFGICKCWQQAIESSGINPDSVDLLIHSAVCRDRLEPATASYVHRQMGLTGRTQIMDVSNACLGFKLIGGFILDDQSGQIKAIIVSAENGKPLIDRTIKLLNSEDHTHLKH